MSFVVTLRPSGVRFQVSPGEPILAAALRQGVRLPYGCRAGACASCKCLRLGGDVVHGAHAEQVLTAHEKAAGLVLSCCAHAHSDVELKVSLLPEGSMAPRRLPARVLGLERRAADVMLVQLQLPQGVGWRHAAGQYVDVLLKDGARRSYSIANALPDDAAPVLELHVRHLPGGRFTDQVFSTLKPHDLLRIEGPLGGFFLREESDKPLILLASGTGLAPIKAIVEHMQARRIARPTILYWGCRTRADLYFVDWLMRAGREWPALRWVTVLSEPQPADDWRGRTGLVHHAVMADWPDLIGHQVYACGAPVMVEAARRDFLALRGLPPDEFFADAFVSHPHLSVSSLSGAPCPT